MSIATWLAEFYPENAQSFADPNNPRTDLEAVDHSILKWTGLQPDNLEKHGLKYVGVSLLKDRGGDSWELDGGSCALCVQNQNSCAPCPLAKVRQGMACSRSYTHVDDFEPSPWSLRKEKPQVMLAWLRLARQYVVQQEPSTYTPKD